MNARNKCQSIELAACQSMDVNMSLRFETFLPIKIFDDFEVKYLPFPERYDSNVNVPFSSIISSQKSIKTIFGHCCFFASDAT